MIGLALFLGSILSGQAAATPDDTMRAEVGRLVPQLDATQLERRESAESELLRLGPAALPAIPVDSDRLSAEVRQRLGRIRQRLQQEAAEGSTGTSTITLNADDMPLSKILRSIRRQSGNTIVDDRKKFGQPVSDPHLTVHLDRTPFWLALDRVLDMAGLTVYLYGDGGSLSLIAAEKQGLDHARNACYSGPFRFEPVSVVARRNLREPVRSSLVVTLETAWEPRLQIIDLVLPMAEVRAVDGHGQALTVADPAAQPEIPVNRNTMAVKLDVPLQLPSRETQIIGRLDGKIVATIPGKIETFRFGHLLDAKDVVQRIAEVTVTVEGVRLLKSKTTDSPHPNPLPKGEGTTYEIRVKIRFDHAGDALASHRQWIFDNKAFLETADGKTIAYESYETTAHSKNEIGLAYQFATDLPMDSLTFVYQTPGTIVTKAVGYQLKDIELP
jgi:hypothetical protein